MADASPGTRVVMLTMQADAEVARRALRAGATGYVRKEAADSELVEAIRRAAAVPLGADGRVASRAHIQEKLRLSTRAELVRYALDRGLLESTGDTA
ncbi:MAG TPA: response regulator [Solirubrobacteraceae bacterium]|nr:response regulator [Solirubrobacteraceae bacterium]